MYSRSCSTFGFSRNTYSPPRQSQHGQTVVSRFSERTLRTNISRALATCQLISQSLIAQPTYLWRQRGRLKQSGKAKLSFSLSSRTIKTRTHVIAFWGPRTQCEVDLKIEFQGNLISAHLLRCRRCKKKRKNSSFTLYRIKHLRRFTINNLTDIEQYAHVHVTSGVITNACGIP